MWKRMLLAFHRRGIGLFPPRLPAAIIGGRIGFHRHVGRHRAHFRQQPVRIPAEPLPYRLACPCARQATYLPLKAAVSRHDIGGSAPSDGADRNRAERRVKALVRLAPCQICADLVERAAREEQEDASLAPDGNSIVFIRNEGGKTEIYEMDLASGNTRQLTDLGQNTGSPEISPDGQIIIFHYRTGNSNVQLWIMNRDGSDPREYYRVPGRDVHDAKAGRLEKQIDRAIHQNPTVLLILSSNSIRSDWVEHEVRMARALEKELGRDVLCPVALDDSWKSSPWPKRLMEQVMEYNILDFSDWERDTGFRRMFDKLIDGLELFYKG